MCTGVLRVVQTHHISENPNSGNSAMVWFDLHHRRAMTALEDRSPDRNDAKSAKRYWHIVCFIWSWINDDPSSRQSAVPD